MTVLLHIFSGFSLRTKLENWSLLDEVIRRTKSVPFLGQPVLVSVFFCISLAHKNAAHARSFVVGGGPGPSETRRNKHKSRLACKC